MNSLITKGLSSINQLLVTLGLGSVEVPIQHRYSGASRRKKVFFLKINIRGQKLFNVKQKYMVSGQKKIKNHIYSSLTGIRSCKIAKHLIATAVLQVPLNIEARFEGISRHIYDNETTLCGVVSHNLNLDSKINGEKRFTLTENTFVTGQRLCPITTNQMICGTKQKQMRIHSKIKGTRDLTNILFSLGLFTNSYKGEK